jgi:thiosulfate/3-mercaptopyruvate sulfurtransferase
MDRNCTACHGSRVKDEFYGNNGPLTARNNLGYMAPLPDVHFAQTQVLNADGYKKGCTFCHTGAEMHGEGAPNPATSGDRYTVTLAPTCEGCHQNLVGADIMHTSGHLATLACQSCHAQPYKNCFGCHTDVDTADTGLPFYRINEGSDPVDGLIPNMTAQPTWKYATPHNIQLNPHAFTCNSCHSATDYLDNWLSDSLLNSEGWLQDAFKADEEAANRGVIMMAPPLMNAQP